MPTDELDAKRNAAIPGMNQRVGAPPKGAAVAGLGDALSRDDHTLAVALADLEARVQGIGMNPNGAPLQQWQKDEALERYLVLREMADEQRAKREGEEQQRRDRAIAEERVKLEALRDEAMAEDARAKLQLEQQRIEVDKARVVVDAIAKIGSDPGMREQFGPLLAALSTRLLEGTTTGVTDKDVVTLRQIPADPKPKE